MFFGAFGQAAHKLVLIPVSVATAMSITIIPTVTKAFVSKEYDKLQGQITQIYQIILFISAPASLGLVLLADAAYGTLYSLEDIPIGGTILEYYAPVAILFSIFAVSTSILQGINRHKFAVVALMTGVAFKAIFNYPFILWFDVGGAILATGVGYLLAIGVCLWAIGRYASCDFHLILRHIRVIGVCTVLMGMIVLLVRIGLGQLLPLDTKFNALMTLTGSVLSGFVVYMFVSIRSGLAGQILGRRLTIIEKFIRKGERD